MKRIMLGVMLLLATVSLTFGQLKKHTNQEKVDILNLSLDLNGAVTLEDLNDGKVYVGDVLRYRLLNGEILALPVELHDNPWKLAEKALAYQDSHPENPIVKDGQQKITDSTKKDEAVIPPPGGTNDSGINWLAVLGILALFGLLFLIAYMASKKEKDKKKNPVTAGLPMHEGGTTPENARAHLMETARQQFGMIPLEIRNLVKGKLTGDNLVVGYTPPESQNFLQRLNSKLMGHKIMDGVEYQTKTFKTPVTAYRGLAIFPGGIEEFVYDLGPCGNRIRRGEGLGGGSNVNFVVDAEQPAVFTTPPATADQSQLATRPTQSAQPQSQAGFSVNLTEITKFAKEVSANADNGKFDMEVEPNKVKITWEFSTNPATLLGTNHVDQQDAKNEVKESALS